MHVLLLLLALHADPPQVVEEEIVIDEGPPCGAELNPCADYLLDTALIEALDRGDASALALLESRYTNAAAYFQRNRLGGALLHKVPDDRAIWRDLYERASLAVEFPLDEGSASEVFRAWCEERGLDAEDTALTAYDALQTAGRDVRSLPLLYRALESGNVLLISAAVDGFNAQHDRRALPAIRRALEKLDEVPDSIEWSLAELEGRR